MICAILLAAGRSRRMGVQKLLLPFGGQTVIGHVADAILASPVAETIVVVGPDAGGIVEALADRPLTIATNTNRDAEMLSSVRCGLRALPTDCETVLVALGDQPAVGSDLIARMVRAYHGTGRHILVPVHGGRRGHPLLFSARYRREVLTHYDDVGLRGLLEAHPRDLFEFQVRSPSVLADMDTPEDYRREVTRHTGSRAAPSS